MSVRGTCLGWSIDADHDFLFLRDGVGQETLQVREWAPGDDPAAGGELLVRWPPRDERAFHGSVHRMTDARMVIETSDAGWFRISPDEKLVEVPPDADPVTREVRLLTTPMLLLAAIDQKTSLHASCVEVEGKAVAISAPGGSGKTTLAAALVGRGHRLMAEDVTILREDGQVLAGPDLLRLRPDIAPRLLGDSDFTVVHENEERVMVTTGTPSFEPVPLAAVVLLKSATEQSVRRRDDPRRLADLWQVGFHFPNVSDRKRVFDRLAALADSTPVYDLERPLTWESMDWSMDVVERLARGEPT